MATTTTTAPAATTEERDESAGEVFLAPRVVDERAFRAFSERLRELVGRASETRESLDGVSGRGAEVLASLEAAAHTQAERAREIARLLEDAEKRIAELEQVRVSVGRDADRIKGFEQHAAQQLAQLTEAAESVVARATEARESLESSLAEARERAEEAEAVYSERVGPRLDHLDGTLARVEQAAEDADSRTEALRAALQGAENARPELSEHARQLDGLREQSRSLLSAMRATILECAEARDAADARLERLSGLAKNAGTVLDTVEQRLRRAEERAERITPGDLDLDPIVKEVADRVMRALDSRIETAAARVADSRTSVTPARTDYDDRLEEIGHALEMLSSIALAQSAPATPGERPRVIPAASPDAPSASHASPPLRFRLQAPARSRRVAVMPEGAAGEYGPVSGGASGAVTLWGWTEHAG